MARRVGDPLRAGLAAALLILLVSVAAVSQMGGRPTPAAVVAPPGAPSTTTDPSELAVTHPHGPTSSTSGPSGPGGPPGPAPPRVPAPPRGRSQVTPACGFSLDPTAPAVPPGQCTVLEVGDSIGSDLGWGLSRHLPAGSGLQMIQMDRTSTGLANTGYWDWPVSLAGYLQRYHPQLVLICLGGNDQQGISADGNGLPFASPAWRSVYLARVTEMISASTDSGAYVLWVGLPVMQQPSYSQGAAYLDGLYAQAVAGAGARHAAFVPTWSLFSSAGGGYASDAQVNGKRATLRQADGIHLSYTGEDVAATYVIEQMASILHVSLAPADPATVTGRY